ncbi:hypothetical protein RYX36_003710 [Vicia faba]
MMTGKAKPKKHTAKEIQAKVDAALTNCGGGKAGLLDRIGVEKKGGRAEEVKKDYLATPIAPNVSLARQHFNNDSEAAINEQINVEYNVSYVYHSLFAFF